MGKNQINISRRSEVVSPLRKTWNLLRAASEQIEVVQKIVFAILFVGVALGFLSYRFEWEFLNRLVPWFTEKHLVSNSLQLIVVIAFVLLVALWLIQRNIVKSFNNVRRVIVLLPITSKNPDRKVASKSNMDGIGKLVEDEQWKKLVAHFDFRFYDHEGDDALLHKQLDKEIGRSAKYFFCTVSEATLGVIKHFRKKDDSESLCFVCTTAGTSELDLYAPNFIRFYIRIKDEMAHMISEAATNHKNIWLIHSAEKYGTDAQKVFAEKVTQGKSIPVDSIVGRTRSRTQNESEFEECLVIEIKNKILGRIAFINDAPTYIFVAAYGMTMEYIVRALEYLRLENKLTTTSIFFTHTVTSIHHHSEEVRRILSATDKQMWKVCVPLQQRLIAGEQEHDTYDENSAIKPEAFTGDVVAEFTYQALRRMLQAVHYSEINNSNFAGVWKMGNYSLEDEKTGTSLEFVWKIGDPGIHLGVDSEVKLNMMNTYDLTYP